MNKRNSQDPPLSSAPSDGLPPRCRSRAVPNKGRSRDAVPSLRLREKRLRALLENSRSAVFIVDQDARILLQAGSRQMPPGRCGEVGALIFACVVSEDRPRARAAFAACLARPGELITETLCFLCHGTPYSVVMSMRNLLHCPDVQGVIVNVCDATSEALTLEALRESEARFHAVFDNAAVGIALSDRDGRFLQINAAFQQMLGYAPHEILGRTNHDVTYSEDRPLVVGQTEAVFTARQRNSVIERRYVRKDGGIVHALVSASAIPDEEGNPTMFIAVADDITSLKAEEEKHRQVIEAIPHLVWVAEPDSRIVYGNERWSRYLGLTDKTMGPQKWLDMVHPDDVAMAQRKWAEAAATGANYSAEFRFRGADGRYRWFLNRAAPIRDSMGRIIHWFGTSTDIDEERRARDEVERLASIVETSQDAILRLDPEGRIISWNSAAHRLFGYSPKDALGQDASILIADSQRDAYRQDLDRLRRGGAVSQVETAGRRKEGREFCASVTVSAIPSNDGSLQGFSVIARDISERKRLENERTSLMRRLVTVQEEERRRLSRELHDQIGQYVTALSLGIRAMAPVMEGDPVGAAKLRHLERMTDQISRDIHHMAWELRPAALDDLGLECALRAYAGEWSRNTGVLMDIHCHGLKGKAMPVEVEVTVYRIVQEALTNVARHAGARRVSIVLSLAENTLQMIVEDDGRGFSDEDTPQSGTDHRFGLVGIRERLGLVGGSLQLETAPGRGTTLYVRIALGDAGERLCS